MLRGNHAVRAHYQGSPEWAGDLLWILRKDRVWRAPRSSIEARIASIICGFRKGAVLISAVYLAATNSRNLPALDRSPGSAAASALSRIAATPSSEACSCRVFSGICLGEIVLFADVLAEVV